MPVTLIFTYEEDDIFYLADKYGLTHFKFNTELERDVFIDGFPKPKPKIYKRKPDSHEEINKTHKAPPVITIEGDADETTDS